ncbi:hypothetical protein DsansV1_C21g0167301 [Dioscorea sansibarensis]
MSGFCPVVCLHMDYIHACVCTWGCDGFFFWVRFIPRSGAASECHLAAVCYFTRAENNSWRLQARFFWVLYKTYNLCFSFWVRFVPRSGAASEGHLAAVCYFTPAENNSWRLQATFFCILSIVPVMRLVFSIFTSFLSRFMGLKRLIVSPQGKLCYDSVRSH